MDDGTLPAKVSRLISFFNSREVINTELKYKDQYELLIAVILSAQCLDSRVNIVTPSLFSSYHNFHELAHAPFEDVLRIIRSISYPEEKARRIIHVAKVIDDEFSGVVPNDFDRLIEIKGIGRKTANLVLAILYDYPGIAVDTHVARLSQRFGLVSTKDPEKIEKTLQAIFPREYHNKINPWFVIYGRYTCKSKCPLCSKCGLKDICSFI